MSKKSASVVAEKPKTRAKKPVEPAMEVPDFLKPAEPVEVTVKKQKPGPKPGVLAVTSPCPYCGEPAHRKAVQNVKGHGPLRRMYCAHGCGHYHYRDVETNEVVEAGRGPRVAPFHSDADARIAQLQAELRKTSQALKRAESHAKQAAKAAPSDGDWLTDIASILGIDPSALQFTADDGKGRPRALVNCLSEADIALFDQDGAETVEKLHTTLLTVQACIRSYKEKAAALAKVAKK